MLWLLQEPRSLLYSNIMQPVEACKELLNGNFSEAQIAGWLEHTFLRVRALFRHAYQCGRTRAHFFPVEACLFSRPGWSLKLSDSNHT